MSTLFVKKQLISADQIKMLIDEPGTISRAGLYRGKSGGGDPNKNGGHINLNSRSTSVKFLDCFDPKFSTINDALISAIPILDKQINPIDYEVFEYNYLIYNVGDHFKWHSDQYETDDPARLRAFSSSTILHLSDDLEGGDFEIDSGDGFKTHVNLDVGETLFFKSTIKHRVWPLQKGKRISLVAWIRKKV